MNLIDLRRKQPEPEGKYGFDPRENEGDGSGSSGPWEHTAGTVGALDSIMQLSDAIERADKANGFVVLKFRRDGCAAWRVHRDCIRADRRRVSSDQ